MIKNQNKQMVTNIPIRTDNGICNQLLESENCLSSVILVKDLTIFFTRYLESANFESRPLKLPALSFKNIPKCLTHTKITLFF